MGGKMTARKIVPPGPGFWWHLKNRTRPSYLYGWLFNLLAFLFTKVTGIPTLTAQLAIRLFRANGEIVDYGVVGYRVVTDAGVAFIVDDFDPAATTDISTLKYHGCGTGTGAESASDTALGTESTTALNPDSTRATGTATQPSANIYRSTGVVTFDASAAITEHGIFSQAATGGGTLLDRSLFSAINVVSGDSISFQYSLTVSSGG
jgi:hypothetical protein